MWIYFTAVGTNACHIELQEEVKEVTSTLSVHGHNIKVTEVLKDGDTLTFLIVSQKVKWYIYIFLLPKFH